MSARKNSYFDKFLGQREDILKPIWSLLKLNDNLGINLYIWFVCHVKDLFVIFYLYPEYFREKSVCLGSFCQEEYFSTF